MAKKPAKKPAKPKAQTYEWGGSKNHTISEATHKQNVEAKGYGIDLNAPVAAPLSNRQAYGQAQQAADLEYKPQIQAAQGIQKAAPVWFGDYVGQVAAQQAAQQAYAAPVLATAQQGVTNAAATAPGLDPSSPQYAKEQQAAQGRQAITQLGASTLAAIPTATNAYFGGLQTTAQRELPQVQAQYGEKVGQLQGARGAAVQTAYGNIRTGEQNADIARSTLNLNTSKAAADVDISRGVDPVTGKPLPTDAPTGYGSGAPGQNKYGYTYDEWNALDPKAQTKARAGKTGPTAAQKAATKKAAEKKTAGIQKATGGVKTKVTDLIAKWDGLRGSDTDDTSKKPDADGNYPARKVTPSDIKKILGAESKDNTPGLIHVMLLVRAGKPLDQSAIDYLHAKDPNIRIPREWIRGKKKAPLSPRTNAPDGYGGSRPT